MNKATFNLIYGELLDNEKFYFNVINNLSSIYVFGKIIGLFKQKLYTLFHHNPVIQDKNVLLCITPNQSRSTLPLCNDKNIIVRPYLDSAIVPGVMVLTIPSLRFFANAIRLFYWLTKTNKLPLKSRFYISIAYFYYYDGFLSIFKKGHPNSVTTTNPSHPLLRAAVEAARTLGIKTVYLPHAHPSRFYPIINTDYALLEGKDGLDYYTFDEKCKKLLVGAIRLDPYKRIKPKEHNNLNILVATNLLDDFKKVKILLHSIDDNPPAVNYQIILRPHPTQEVNSEEFSDIKNIVFSDSRVESCLEALSRSDILIAANTTTFFEAIYLPVKCFYYDFVKEGKAKDNYELMSYSFIKKLDDIKQLYNDDIVDNKKDLDRVDYSFGRFNSSLNKILDFYANL